MTSKKPNGSPVEPHIQEVYDRFARAHNEFKDAIGDMKAGYKSLETAQEKCGIADETGSIIALATYRLAIDDMRAAYQQSVVACAFTVKSFEECLIVRPKDGGGK